MDKENTSFEGVEISRCRDGKYRCPFGCGDERWAKPTWKTKKGIKGHLELCTKQPSRLKEKEKRREKERLRILTVTQIIKDVFCNVRKNHRLGDTLYYVAEAVLFPTHENRNGRRVKVRYEEKHSYSVGQFFVSIITCSYSPLLGFDGDISKLYDYICYNGVNQKNVFAKKIDALRACAKKAEDQERALHECSNYR